MRAECGGGKFNLIGNGPRWECPGFHDGDKFQCALRHTPSIPSCAYPRCLFGAHPSPTIAMRQSYSYCRNSTTTPERLPFEIPTELHGLIPPGPTETQRKNAAVVPVAMPMDAD